MPVSGRRRVVTALLLCLAVVTALIGIPIPVAPRTVRHLKQESAQSQQYERPA